MSITMKHQDTFISAMDTIKNTGELTKEIVNDVGTGKKEQQIVDIVNKVEQVVDGIEKVEKKTGLFKKLFPCLCK
jgi:uncharacterized protein Yka (UPF0111/DUF47 family)